MSGRWLTLAAEGPTDQLVLARLAEVCGWSVQARHGGRGKSHLMKRLASFNEAARHAPWVVLLDLDRSADCAPAFVAGLPPSAPFMRVRIAVRAIEAWLLADRARLARYLQVSQDRIPADPERCGDPKQVVVGLARSSRDAAIRHDMVPRPGTGVNEGPAYAARLQEFARERWDIEAAAAASPSLRRCLLALQGL